MDSHVIFLCRAARGLHGTNSSLGGGVGKEARVGIECCA